MRRTLILPFALALILCGCPKDGDPNPDGGSGDGGGYDTPFEVFAESSGNPSWRVAGFQQFAAPIGTSDDGYADLQATLEALLPAPGHEPGPGLGLFRPGEAHGSADDPSVYESEWEDGVTELGFVHTATFSEAQFTEPSAVYLVMTLIPNENAQRGTTPDYDLGPMLDHDLFPMQIDGEVLRQGVLVDPDLDFTHPSLASLDPPIAGDGYSHLHLVFIENRQFFSVDTLTDGFYEWGIEITDRQGMRWTLSIPFTVRPDDPGGTTDGGGGSADPCLAGGPCEPNRYADTEGTPYPTGAYPNLLLRLASGQLASANRNGEIVHVAGSAEDQAIRYWLMSRVNDSGRLTDLFGGSAPRVNRMYVFVDSAGNPLGRPVLEVAPDSGNTSPLLQVVEVQAVDGYTPDGIKSAQTLRYARRDPATGFQQRATNRVELFLPVDPTVTLQDGTAGSDYPQPMQVWYGKQLVHGYRIPGGEADGTLTVTPSADPETAPPTVQLGELWQFRLEGAGGAGACGGGNIHSHRLGSAGYSPVMTVHITETPDCAQVPTNAADVQAGISGGTFTVVESLVAMTPQLP